MNEARKLVDMVRTKHQLALADIANRIGFSRTYISEVYNEKRQASPDFLAKLQRLAEIPTLKQLMEKEKPSPGLQMGGEVALYAGQREASTPLREEPPNHLAALSMEELEAACAKQMQDAFAATGVNRLLALISLDKLTKELIQRTQKSSTGH